MAKNFPYDPEFTLEMLLHPPDRYKQNYDKVFEPVQCCECGHPVSVHNSGGKCTEPSCLCFQVNEYKDL